jgi:FAD/FMN-containing dehydrogenase
MAPLPTCVERYGHAGAAQRHTDKVEQIAQALRTRTSTRPLSLRKSTPSHQVPKALDAKYTDDKLDVSALDEILEIDVARRTCTAEPGVTFDDLVRATLARGLVPQVVPELKSITLGGAVSGCSIESMSFRVGGFHDTCLEYELLTAKGEVLTCTPENENALLFQMEHGSFGTLGVLSKLRFTLVPAKPFVQVRYEKYDSLDGYLGGIQRRYEAKDAAFMDGIIHSPRELVLSVGDFVDEAPYAHRYDWLRVYYRSTKTRDVDYLRTPHYFYRYDHGVTDVRPKSFLGRLLFGPFVGSTEILKLAETFHYLLPKERPNIILDVFIPLSKVNAFFDWYQKEFRHFPLWCVPYKLVRHYEWLADSYVKGLKDELFLDLAIYGMKQTGDTDYVRLMEKQLLEIGGLKTLISHNQLTEDEFWSIWNKGNYERAKARVDPDHVFRDLYEKTCRRHEGTRRLTLPAR